MPTPMKLYFPAFILEEARKHKEQYDKKCPRASQYPVTILYKFTKSFQDDLHYGFFEQLLDGNYVPTREERSVLNINSYNCTTGIQVFYQTLEGFGFQPQIVQFFGFRNVWEKKDKKVPLESEHFSLLIPVKKKGL